MRVGRDLLILAGLVLVLAAGTLFLVSRERPVGPPYRLDGHGAGGLSGLGAGLDEAGIDVRSGRRPTIPSSGLTVTVEPRDVSLDEADRWAGAVGDGATLVIASDRPDALLSRFGLSLTEGRGNPAPTPSGAAAFPDAMPPSVARTAFSGVPRDGEVLWTDAAGSPVAVVIPSGRGSVWAFSDPGWLTNRGVEAAGLPIVLPLARSAGGSVTIDEYHHGRGEPAGSFGYLPRSLQLALLQGGIVLLAAAATVARRLGPVRPQRDPPTRSTAELASSLARMHRQAGQLEAATAPLARAVHERLGAAAARVHEPLEHLERANGERDAVEAWREIDEATRRLTGAHR